VQGYREAIRQDPTQREREAARRLQVAAASGTARVALNKGKLQSLGAELRNGVVYISGRVRKEHMAELVGREELAVVMPTEKLARLVMLDAHNQDHRRSPQDVMARARRHLWIPQGTRLAKEVIGKCVKCRLNNNKMARQIMASLPPERLQAAAPFEFTALDMFGPVMVKDPARGRRRFKCWIVMFTCLACRAVAMFASPGYDTKTFLVTYSKFTSTYNSPRRCYADHGPQIKAGAEAPDWEEVKQRGGEAGTDWIFTAKGCSWRNGAAERAIRMARHTLLQLLQKNQTLDFHELEALLARAAFLINSRPLSVRLTGVDEYYSITANDLLLGRAVRSPADLERLGLGEEQDLEAMVGQQEETARAWWVTWMSKCFPDLVPRTKWKTKHRNLREKDICHIKYASKHTAPAYRLCRVSKVFPDHEGVVRTVEVEMRPRRQGKTGAAKYTHKNPVQMKVGVQRLAVVLPREEQEAERQQSPNAPAEEIDVAERDEERGLVSEKQQGPARTPPGEDRTAVQASKEAGEEVQGQVQGGATSKTKGEGRRKEVAASSAGSTRVQRKGRKDINYKE
jgi:hypothetical protein